MSSNYKQNDLATVKQVEVMGVTFPIEVSLSSKSGKVLYQVNGWNVPKTYQDFIKETFKADNLSHVLKYLAVRVVAHDMQVAFMPLKFTTDGKGYEWVVELGELWEGSGYDNIADIKPNFVYGAASVDCTFDVFVRGGRGVSVLHKTFMTKTVGEIALVLADTWGVLEDRLCLPIPIEVKKISDLKEGDCFTYLGANDKTKQGCLVYKGMTNSVVVDYPPMAWPTKEYLVSNTSHATLIGRNLKAYLPFRFTVRIKVTYNSGERVDTHSYDVSHNTTYEAKNTAYIVAMALERQVVGAMQVDVIGLLGEVVHSVDTRYEGETSLVSAVSICEASEIIYKFLHNMFI